MPRVPANGVFDPVLDVEGVVARMVFAAGPVKSMKKLVEGIDLQRNETKGQMVETADLHECQ